MIPYMYEFLYLNRVKVIENIKLTKLDHVQITIMEYNYQTTIYVEHN